MWVTQYAPERSNDYSNAHASAHASRVARWVIATLPQETAARSFGVFSERSQCVLETILLYLRYIYLSIVFPKYIYNSYYLKFVFYPSTPEFVEPKGSKLTSGVKEVMASVYIYFEEMEKKSKKVSTMVQSSLK